MNRVIKNKKDYEAALSEVDILIEQDPAAGTPEGDRLELLALLIENYETKNFPVELPDPIDAIRFRMEQQGLKQRDLIPYIGSRSKVSEVLMRKRPLTLPMLKAIHSGLGIPAKVLLEGQKQVDLDDVEIEWNRFPLREMIKRRWINEKFSEAQKHIDEVLSNFFTQIGNREALALALYKKTDHVRSGRSMDRYALVAWTTRIIIKSRQKPPSTTYKAGSVDKEFLLKVAQLSVSDLGPQLALEFLGQHGISLVIEPHLPHTYLDGASIVYESNKPVIGLTLRYDRIDNFWFCLMHELAHLSLHFDGKDTCFYDNLEVDAQGDLMEQEADELAGEILIPEAEWKKSPASKLRSPEAAGHLAKQLGIHPAIVAGRMRYESKAYKLLNHIVGHRKVRKLFPKVRWS